MSHKLLMDGAAYFATQQLYRGWALFGAPIVIKIVLDVVLGALLLRRHPAAGYAALTSATLVAAGLIVFFVCVQPANVATANWTAQPSDWKELRQNWECGHLSIAILTLLAFVAVSFSLTGLIRQDCSTGSSERKEPTGILGRLFYRLTIHRTRS